MGPLAGNALFNSITRQTKALNDQQHLSVILMSFPGDITDRTAFLEGESNDNPAFKIAEIIKKLEVAGAGIVGMACNTAHAPEIFSVLLNELNKINCRIRLLNMPMETCSFIKKMFPSGARIGLMTTNGTYRTGIYKNLLQQASYEVIVPDFQFQNEIIHKMIYDEDFGLKSVSAHIHPRINGLVKKALCFFKKNRADAVIIGCTELSMVLQAPVADGMQMIDSTEVLACALIREAQHF
jgi:aspartate racemase